MDPYASSLLYLGFGNIHFIFWKPEDVSRTPLNGDHRGKPLMTASESTLLQNY